MIAGRLKAMKDLSKMTSQEIADVSQVPLGTISRILSGQTESPSFDTVAAMVKAMGGSLDELADIPPRVSNLPAVTPADDRLINLYRETIRQRDEVITYKNKWLIAMATFGAFMALLLVGFLIYDITHLDIGYITKITEAVRASAQTLIGDRI